MNKLANMRHWQERMSPNFGMSRSNVGVPILNPHQKTAAQGPPPIAAPQPPDATIYYSFNVPLSSDLAGPDTEEILHATTDAVLRWTHPESAPDDVPVHELPVHAHNLAQLRKYCKNITQQSGGALEAHVISTTPKNSRSLVTTVCLAGPAELVYRTRETILNETPLSLVRVPCFSY
jgi:hypothetical protein